MPGGEDQQGSREVWSLCSPYLPVKVLFLLGLDPTLSASVQPGAKAKLQSPAHNGASGFCTANAQKLETEARPGEPSPVCRRFSAPLSNKATELPEARDEPVGMQECRDGGVLCPQGDQTPKGFPHMAAVQQVLRAEQA